MSTKSIKIPNNYTEEEVLRILDKISSRLASKFNFGYHDIEDIKQQAIFEGLLALEKYDNVRPLENFLWVAIKNKLFNFKRDNYERNDKPCDKCPIKQYDKENRVCKKYNKENLEDCKWFYLWIIRNNTKKNLMDAIGIDNVDYDNENSMCIKTDYVDELNTKEIINILEEEIPMEFYSDYHRFKSGAKISTNKKNQIKGIILEILNRYGYV